MEYIYILREREFIRLDEEIYKIGRTKRPIKLRLKEYPKNSELLGSFECDDCIFIERMLIRLFKTNYIHRNDIGNEYFEGNINNMINNINETIEKYKINSINNINDINNLSI